MMLLLLTGSRTASLLPGKLVLAAVRSALQGCPGCPPDSLSVRTLSRRWDSSMESTPCTSHQQSSLLSSFSCFASRLHDSARCRQKQWIADVVYVNINEHLQTISCLERDSQKGAGEHFSKRNEQCSGSMCWQTQKRYQTCLKARCMHIASKYIECDQTCIAVLQEASSPARHVRLW